MFRKYYLLIILIFSIFGCHSNEDILEIRDYFTEGTADSNHLEKGNWKYFDLATQKLCQEGQFSNGVRVGRWKYYIPQKDSIEWMPFLSKDSIIRTNIPAYFQIENDVSGYVAFNHKDTSLLLKLKIATASISSFDIEAYRKVMHEEVKFNSLYVSTPMYSIINTTCNQTYYMSRFEGVDKLNRNYTLMTINSVLESGFLAEVTIRFDSELLFPGEEIFYSIMSNLYINKDRFFDGNIDCEIIKKAQSRSRYRFSFGRNRSSF